MNREFEKIASNISNRILILGPDYVNHRGGIGAVIDVYSKHFDKFKFLATFKNGFLFIKISFFFLSVFKLIYILSFNRKIKIIHIHGASRGSFVRKFICFLIAKYLFRKIIIYHIHGAEYHLFYEESSPIVKKAIRMFINNSNTIVCLSEVWKSFFTLNFNVKKIVIVPNIIDYPSVYNVNKESSVLELLFLGQIGNRKGIFDLLIVISTNKKKYTGKIKLESEGNGELERLMEIIKKEQLEGIVEFIGWVTKEEKINFLQDADVYILPSYNEGLPISILEAMSYGKAIISTNVGGISEIVIPGKNGVLVKPGNLNEIENAINFFLDNPQKIISYGIESKQLVKKYLPNSVIFELSHIYQSLLK